MPTDGRKPQLVKKSQNVEDEVVSSRTELQSEKNEEPGRFNRHIIMKNNRSLPCLNAVNEFQHDDAKLVENDETQLAEVQSKGEENERKEDEEGDENILKHK